MAKQNNNRTIAALQDILQGKVWVYLKDEETCRRFYEDAQAEGFRFGTIPPTKSQPDDIIALHNCRQLSHTGFAGHMAFYQKVQDLEFHRINYARYVSGEEDFYFHPEDLKKESRPLPDYEAAHKGSSQNRTIIQNSKTCGCFYCLSIFPAEEVQDWTDDMMEEPTALCPNCGIDSVIGDASGYEITEDLLRKMMQHWFW